MRSQPVKGLHCSSHLRLQAELECSLALKWTFGVLVVLCKFIMFYEIEDLKTLFFSLYFY